MCVHVVGEMLSLLVTRTSPGLGNATVDWVIQGPRVARTFTHTSGLLFFTEVNKLTGVTPRYGVHAVSSIRFILLYMVLDVRASPVTHTGNTERYHSPPAT